MGYVDTQLFINGKWQEPAEGRTLPVVNPSTGKEIGRVAHAGRTDLDHALAAARRLRGLAGLVPAERSKIMRRTAALMRGRAADAAAQERASRSSGEGRDPGCRRHHQ
jgi:succinate-semialdehyde dehydrogenase/glutarate-semialdehyde dehydrogenase